MCTFHTGPPAGRPAVYPPEFASWAEAHHGNAAFEAGFGGGLAIRYPVEGAVYFYDPNVPPNTQAIRVEVIHPGRTRPLLFVNGRAFSEPPVTSNTVMTLNESSSG